MGNTIFIKDRKVCVKPLRNRIEAILKLEPSKTPKGCRSFGGMVNLLSIICPELQKLLKPIYDLTRKGRPFIWGEEKQEAFEKIKRRLVKVPVLHMPNREGRFHLYSDISKFTAGSVLYRIQNRKPKLIAYASKRLPEAIRSYSITELELCGLAINIASFSHLLKRVDFDAIVNHLALTYIIKSTAEPATTRIKRLLELISSYSFNLYYMKGKDMILSDFLSRQTHGTSNLHEVIPISFNMYDALYEIYYRVEPTDRYLVQMQSQTKAAGVILPEVHDTWKTINVDLPIEKQKPQIQKKQVDNNRPKLGRGRAGMQCKHPQPVADPLVSANKSPKIPANQKVTIDSTKFPVLNQLITHKAETITTRQVQDKNREQPCQPDPYFRPPPRPPSNLLPESLKTNIVTKMNIDVDFEENSPHQEGIISELYQRPNKTYFHELKDLESLVNTSNLVQKFLPKQADIDKILKINQCKVLKVSHLLVTVKEIQVGYLNSLYFKEIYLY